MKRIVQSELLDLLPPTDPQAMRSRRDLCRVNAWMRNHLIAATSLKSGFNGTPPARILDLGAGDGDFLLRVARLLAPAWPHVNVSLLDQQSVPKGSALTSFAQLGWQAEVVVVDVFKWAKSPDTAPAEAIVSNLFLHHFKDEPLAELLGAIARRARIFVAVEPRRGRWPLLGCCLLRLIGCNSVTRHDAGVSVRAGFCGHELSALWPEQPGWRLTERPAGLFSHLFVAQKID